MLDKLLLIKEILELVYYFRKFILFGLLFGFIIIVLLLSLGHSDSKHESKEYQLWKNIKCGDSIFVKDNVYYLHFYKKGRQKLDDYEQSEIKYKRDDTLNFIEQNSVHEKFFYQNHTSFVGICLGKDSSITHEGELNGHKWIIIKPSYSIAHPPKSDKFDFESRKWKNNTSDYFAKGKLSKDFYVNLKDIQISNNDSIFR